jgi:hypothetical protein
MNPIYWKEFVADSGRAYHCSFYPRASAFDAVQPFPGLVELPKTVLLSGGTITKAFDTIPYGFSETSSLTMTINLTNAPSLFRNRCLENPANTFPFVVVVRGSVSLQSPYTFWHSKALFCGAMKRVPTSTIHFNEQGDEVMDIVFVDIVRYLSELVSLTDGVGDLSYTTVERLYSLFYTDSFATNGYFEFGGPKAPLQNDARTYETKAHLCSLSEYLSSRITLMQTMMQKMLFSESASIERSDYPWEGELVQLRRSTCTQERSQGLVCDDPLIVGKITKPPHDESSIVGGLLYDEQGFQRFSTFYDLLRRLTEQMGCTFHSNFEWTSGTLHFEWTPIFQEASLEIPSDILDEGREIEIGAGSLRSIRVHYTPEQQSASEIVLQSIVGAESEQDYDIEVFLHSQPYYGGRRMKSYPVVEPIPSTLFPQPWKMNRMQNEMHNPDIATDDGYTYAQNTSTMEAGEGFLYGALFSLESHPAMGASDFALRLHESVAIAISDDVTITSSMPSAIADNVEFEEYFQKTRKQTGFGIALSHAVASAFLRTNSSHLRFKSVGILPYEVGCRVVEFSAIDIGFSSLLDERLSTDNAVLLSCEHSLETGISSLTIYLQGV